jgi:hypothetical protein
MQTKYIYFFDGGGFVTASDPSEFVDAMRSDSRAPSISRQQFMEDVSTRCKCYNGSEIDWYNDQQFLDDLIAGGFVTVCKTN